MHSFKCDDGCVIHHNGDYSGSAILYRHGVEFTFPCEKLLAFAEHARRKELIRVAESTPLSFKTAFAALPEPEPPDFFYNDETKTFISLRDIACWNTMSPPEDPDAMKKSEGKVLILILYKQGHEVAFSFTPEGYERFLSLALAFRVRCSHG